MRAALVAAAVLVVGCALVLSCHSSTTEPSVARGKSAAIVWAHEPAGLSTLTDHAWTDLASGGWNRRPSGDDRVVADPTAPAAPATALEYVFPVGFPGGTAPATHYFPVSGRTELFIGLEFEVSQPWQGHASFINKVQFLYTRSSDVAMVMYGGKTGPYELRVMPQWPENHSTWLTPNVTKDPVTLGGWHRLEWQLKYESAYGAGDGIIRWWLDGALVGDYANVRYPNDGGFTEYQISPTWGGVGDMKTEADFYRFNRSYISAR